MGTPLKESHTSSKRSSRLGFSCVQFICNELWTNPAHSSLMGRQFILLVEAEGRTVTRCRMDASVLGMSVYCRSRAMSLLADMHILKHRHSMAVEIFRMVDAADSSCSHQQLVVLLCIK
jgi:hypothetical protein